MLKLTQENSARNLGVIFGEVFNFRSHTSAICSSYIYHIRDLRRIRRHLHLGSAKLLVNILVSSVPLLRSLHWLPVKYRFHFKICLLTYRALYEEQPVYLRSLIVTYLPSRSLRSNRGISLSIPRIRTNSGESAFGSCARFLWNNLPLSVH